MEDIQFFTDKRCPITLTGVKPKLNSQSEKRIRFDFSLPLTSKLLESAPTDVKDAFYALAKDGSHLNPIGIATEFEGVVASFFETVATKSPTLELANCQIRQLEVSRPENKIDLADGDVRLGFHMNVPGSREAWAWAYRAFGTDLCAVFEAMQPVFPQIKAASPNGDGQGILNMEKQEEEPTVVKADDMPRQGKTQKAAVSKIKATQKAKK
jgi:hypothetical protein